jgi:hypothetical protein
LLWCITAPELLDDCPEHISHLNPFFADHRFARMFANAVEAALLRKLNRQPDWLIEQLNQLKTRRLGERFELLIRLAFELHPDFQIIAHNFAVQDERITVGELDLVVVDEQTHQVFHLELACKFYLQLQCNRQTYWIGPGLKDRLDIKLHRLLNHQLRLVETEAGRSLLQQKGWLPIRSCSLFKGRRFYALTECENSRAEWVWGTAAQILNHYEGFNWQWQQLTKDEWLAPLQSLTREQSLHMILSRPIDRPVQLAAIDGEREVKRLFWVPDDWYRKAVAQLAR